MKTRRKIRLKDWYFAGKPVVLYAIFTVIILKYVCLIFGNDDNVYILKMYTKNQDVLLTDVSLRVLFADRKGAVHCLEAQDTDKDGIFQINAELEGRIVIQAQSSYGILHESMILSPTVKETNLSLRPGIQISGKVIDRGNGLPLKNASVDLLPYAKWPRWESTTNENGEYAIKGVLPDYYNITTNCVSFNAELKSISLNKDSILNFSLGKSKFKEFSLSGMVCEKESNKPLKDANINIVFGLVDPVSACSDENGRYSINNIRPVSSEGIFMTVSKLGYLPKTEDISLLLKNEATNELNLYLKQCGYVTGHVLNENDETPLREVLVTIWPVYGNNPAGSAYTDDSGEYIINRLENGTYKLKVGDMNTSRLFDIVENKPKNNFNVKIKPYTLAGLVIDENGIPVIGAWVRLNRQRYYNYYYDVGDVVTDKNGRFFLNEIVNEILLLDISCPYEPQKVLLGDEINFKASDKIVRKFILYNGEIISGYVQTIDKEPLNAWQVSARLDNTPVAFCKTNTDGYYEFFLPSGVYNVQVKDSAIDTVVSKEKMNIPTKSTNVNFLLNLNNGKK